jgi:hypothetical protein
VKVLSEAALRANCVVHLGIVHIEESGSAESFYDGYYNRRSRRRRYGYYEEEGDQDEDASDRDFEIIEVSDSNHFVDSWIDPDNGAREFGRVPLDDGELLPDGALDGERPDAQRVMEATGNEGASFERSYHRAALIVWRKDRYAEALLRAGAGAAIPYLKERVHALAASAGQESRVETTALANRILDRWESAAERPYYSRDETRKPGRAEMLEILRRLGDPALIDRFVVGIVTKQYDGTENAEIIGAASLLGTARAGDLLSSLTREAVAEHFPPAVELLSGFGRWRRTPEGSRRLRRHRRFAGHPRHHERRESAQGCGCGDRRHHRAIRSG